MKVSIITVVYNGAATIASSIQSVLSQDYPDIEYIVIDGQSTDGTVEIIEQYRAHIDAFVSEKDNGLYDALNKGISLASGEVIGILHADDLFYSDQVISEVASNFQKKTVDCLYGDLVYVEQTDTEKIIRTWKSGSFQREEFLNGWMPPHPTFFVKRESFRQNGLYDTNFQNSADYELMLRYLYKNNLKTTYLDKNLVRMRVGGLSSGSLKGRLRANKEDMQAWEKNNLQPKPYTRFLKPLRKLGQFSLQHYSYKSSISLSLALPFLMSFFHEFFAASGSLSHIKVAMAMIFAWGVAAVSVPVVIKIAEIKQLTDRPNGRSSHSSPTPTLGGISVFAALLLSLTIWGVVDSVNGLQYIIGALVLTFFTGLKDDMLIIAPNKKLMSQILVAALIIVGADLRIESLYGVFGIEELPHLLSLFLTVFVFVAITNAYNLIDGIDGLASSLGIIAAVCFGTWFIAAKHFNFAILAFSTAGALIGFVKYNFSKNQKIFLGDTGSLIVGLLCATLALQFIKVNAQAVQEYYYLQNAHFIAIGVLSIPLFDTLRVFGDRIYRKKSPFAPEKNHLHHLLIKRNSSHKRATFIICTWNLLFTFTIFFCFVKLSSVAASVVLLLLFILYLMVCYQLQDLQTRAFKIFFLRYAPPVYDIFQHKYLK